MKVSKSQLLNELELVSAGLSNREIVEQSDCFIFTDGKLYTFNEEVSCSCDTILSDLTAAVKAEPLLAVLRKMSEEEVEIQITDSEFKIRGKKREAGIRLEQDIVLPIHTVEVAEEWKPLSDEFAEAVTLVSQCTSNDDTQFRLTCIHITPDGLETTDNYQLSRYIVKTEIDAPTLVRKDSLKNIVDLGMIEIAETKDWLHFKNPNGLILSCRRYSMDDNAFPDFDSIIQFDGQKTKLPTGISEAVEKAEIFSSQNIDDDKILVELKAGKLRIKGEGNSGWFTEIHTVDYTGDDLRFRIAPKMLIDISSKYDECKLNSKLMKVDGGDFTYVTLLSVADNE